LIYIFPNAIFAWLISFTSETFVQLNILKDIPKAHSLDAHSTTRHNQKEEKERENHQATIDARSNELTTQMGFCFLVLSKLFLFESILDNLAQNRSRLDTPHHKRKARPSATKEHGESEHETYKRIKKMQRIDAVHYGPSLGENRYQKQTREDQNHHSTNGRDNRSSTALHCNANTIGTNINQRAYHIQDQGDPSNEPDFLPDWILARWMWRQDEHVSQTSDKSIFIVSGRSVVVRMDITPFENHR
jgi:hypothetical protein